MIADLRQHRVIGALLLPINDGVSLTRMCRLARVADAEGVPWLLVVAAKSWETPPCALETLVPLLSWHGRLEQYAYGGDARQSVEIVAGNLSPDDCSRLGRRCGGQQRFCTKRDGQHKANRGYGLAHPPKQLTEDIAFTLLVGVRLAHLFV